MKLMRAEVSALLGKGAVEPASSEEGFYSTLFLVPKTEGRMRPVINLKALNFWHTQKSQAVLSVVYALMEV